MNSPQSDSQIIDEIHAAHKASTSARDAQFVLSDLDVEAVESGWHVCIVLMSEQSASGVAKGAWPALLAACGPELADTLLHHAESGITQTVWNDKYRCNQLIARDSEDDILYTIFSR